MFQVCGAFSEFERSMTQQRIKLGLKRAVAQGKRLGRPKTASHVERAILATLKGGMGIVKAAKMLGVGVGTVARIKQALAA